MQEIYSCPKYIKSTAGGVTVFVSGICHTHFKISKLATQYHWQCTSPLHITFILLHWAQQFGLRERMTSIIQLPWVIFVSCVPVT